MSGGRYNYAYQKIDDLKDWISTLNSMHERLHEWATDPDLSKYDNEGKKYIPATLTDRAMILVKALLIKRIEARITLAHVELIKLREILRTIEWVASGDYEVSELMKED